MGGGPAGMALGLLPAHAISPVGGVAVNLAIQDAVAATNQLALPLRDNRLKTDGLVHVQMRQAWPMKTTQRVQLSSVSEGNSL
jgi:2-polyprenyl-6-methoxyphenol hydroxylase-like FAD-dependent oxidoreductase